ncbi:hypothetical protein JCM8547_008177 [Rhodosporidiobolus lusitaniae]
MVLTRSQRIRLKSLSALTLHSSKKTAHRRTSPVPQLTCQGKACRQFQPDVVQCVKVGEDGAGGLEWKCEANLPRGVRFGEVEVSCEGWDNPGDPYILRGSCGLTYNLVRSSSHLEDGSSSSWTSLPSYLSRPSSIFDSASILLFLSLTLYLLLSLLLKLYRRFFPSPHSFSGNGRPPRPPPDGPSSRPPPPPSDPPPPPYTDKPFSSPSSASSSSSSWRPGFWTGAALGWATNAFLASSRERERQRGWPAEDPYAAYRGAPVGGGGGFWGGGGAPQRGGLFGGGGLGGGWGGGGGMQQLRQRGWGWGGGGGSDSGRDRGFGGGSGGGGLRRSTGFGGTNVR